MVTARGVTRGVLWVGGVALVAFAATLLRSVETPPGGGDIPTGFAVLFGYVLVLVGTGAFAVGTLLLDDTGVGTYFTARQRRTIRVGGAFLGLAALAPLLAVFLVPLVLGVAGGLGPDAFGTVVSAAVVGWLALLALGLVGVIGGLAWRLGEAVRGLVRQSD